MVQPTAELPRERAWSAGSPTRALLTMGRSSPNLRRDSSPPQMRLAAKCIHTTGTLEGLGRAAFPHQPKRGSPATGRSSTK